MLKRDYFMRQVQQLVQVLQQVLDQKREGQLDEAHHTIKQAISELDEEERTHLRGHSLQETIGFCKRNESFRPNFAVSIADLLQEEGELLARQQNKDEAEKSYARALLLYRRAMREKAAALPWNIGVKLRDLEAKLSPERVEGVRQVLKETD